MSSFAGSSRNGEASEHAPQEENNIEEITWDSLQKLDGEGIGRLSPNWSKECSQLFDVLSSAVEGSTDGKIGLFDWIAGYSQLQAYVTMASIICQERSHQSREQQRVLVIGCGTSPLSVDLLGDGFEEVVSLDNDLGCVQHMRQLYSGEPRLRWLHYDLVTGEGQDAQQVQSLTESFDIVIDKGTLDAILVEGTCWQMLAEVYRMLSQTGIYLLCSIHTQQLLSKLFAVPSLNMVCDFPEIVTTTTSSASSNSSSSSSSNSNSSSNPLNGSIVLAWKSNQSLRPANMNWSQLAIEEEEIMDLHFQVEHPFLTSELEALIRDRFQQLQQQQKWEEQEKGEEETDAEVGISIRSAFDIMFEGNEDYTFELFLEDLQSFPLRNIGRMSIDESLGFIRCMQ